MASPSGHDLSQPVADAFVLDANLRQSLVAVRSLGRAGVSVGCVHTGRRALAFASRWCRARWTMAGPEGSDAYGDELLTLLARTGEAVVVPSSDGTIELLRRRRAEFERHARLALASEPALENAIDKERTLCIAARLGLAVPRQILAESTDDVARALDAIGLPAVVKPCVSWQERAGASARLVCTLVTTPGEALLAVADLTRFGGATLVQEFLTGRRDAVSFLYANGRIRARFAQTAVRTCPPLGGESVLRQSIPLPRDVTERAEALVRAIGLEGYSEVEFRYDAAGVPRLMEINPRLSASVEVAVRSGVDFPRLVYQWARGGRVDTVETYRTGLWMRYLRGDIMTTCEAFRRRGRPDVSSRTRALVDFGAACLRPMAYDGFDWSDLRPALRATGTFARALARRLAGGVWSEV